MIENATKEYKLYFMGVARRICPEWQVRNKELVNAIFDWCMYHKGALDYNKGIWLYGANGTGKTTLLRIIERFRSEIMGLDSEGNERGKFTISPMSAVRTAYQQGENLREYIERLAQAFDDVTTEDMQTLEFVIKERYPERCWNITHATSEYGFDELPTEIKEKCSQMFNFVRIDY